jgi:hypothetical protein
MGVQEQGRPRSVFTAAQWNAQQDRMIHESWLAEAAKRLGPASR